MDDGVGDEVTPLDAAHGGHLQGKENEYLLRPESCNRLEPHELCLPNDDDITRHLHQEFEEMLDGKNMQSIGHVNVLEHPYSNIPPHPMDDAGGATVEELTVKNFGGPNLAIVGSGTSINSGRAQMRQNQWQHLYQLAGGSGSASSRGNTAQADNVRRTTGGSEDIGFSSFPEYLTQKACNENKNDDVEDLGNASGSIRTRIISKSGFSEFFVKNSLKGKGIVFKGVTQDGSLIESRDQYSSKLTGGTMAPPGVSRGASDRNVDPSLYVANTKAKNGGNDCDGINMREWLRVGRSQANKTLCLYIFRQIVELVDYSHSQGVPLHRLKPSCFKLLNSNKVKYLRSPDRKQISQSIMSHDMPQSEDSLARKRLVEQNSFPLVSLSAKKQRFLIQNTGGVPKQWPKFPTNFKPEVANPNYDTIHVQQSTYSEFDEDGNLVMKDRSERRFDNPLVLNTREQRAFAGEQLEEKWYTSPDESDGGSCTVLSNIYGLGVFLFELLASFDSDGALVTAMSDLRYRILPPNFLSENPKEAGFCLWLLHPEPSSRPTTREILQSEVVNGLPEACTEELVAAINQEDSETDLLMYFMTALNEQKQKDVSKLVDAIQCLETDIKEIEKRNLSDSCLRAEPSVFDRQHHSSNDLSMLPLVSNTSNSRLTTNIDQIESAYFSMRAKLQIPGTDVDVRQDNDLLRNRENWYSTQKDEEGQLPTDRMGTFFDGLCKYARYSRFEVRGVLRSGDYSSSSNVICSLSFDRDEDYFAAAGISKKIKIFEFNALLNDSVDIHYPAIEMPNKSKLSCVCWNSYIKNYLASTDYDGAVKVWDVTTGQAFTQYNEHEKRAWSVDFSKVCPTKLASGSDDCSVKLWNINEKNCLGTIRNVANVCCVQFSAHSTYLLAFGSADYRTYCYDLRYAKTPWCVLGGHEKAVSYVKFLDSETIVSASTDNSLKIWDLNKTTSTGSPNACSLTLTGHTNEKNFVGLSVADGYIACGSESNEVYAYYRSLPMPITSHKFGSIDSISGKETEDDNGQFVSSVCWRAKSEMVVAANSSGCIKVLQMI